MSTGRRCVPGLLTLALLAVSFEALAREDDNVIWRPMACALLLTGPLMPCLFRDAFVMPALWAGILIPTLVVCYNGLNFYFPASVPDARHAYPP